MTYQRSLGTPAPGTYALKGDGKRVVLHLVRDYGADPTGAADCTAAIDSAHADATAAIASGAASVRISFGPGTFKFAPASLRHAFRLTANQFGEFVIDGFRKATKILLSSTTPTFLGLDDTTTGPTATFGNVTLRDLTFDAASISSVSDGAYIGVVAGMVTNANYTDITFERLRTLNVGTPVIGSGRRNIDITPTIPTNGLAVAYTAQRIKVRECDFGVSGGGGNGGVAIQAFTFAADTPNTMATVWRTGVYFDDIEVSGCRWDSGITSYSGVGSTGWFSSGIIIGNHGHGGRVRVLRNYLRGSADDGIEINSFLDVLIDGNITEDARNEHVYFPNIGGMLTSEQQVIRVRNHVSRHILVASPALIVSPREGTALGVVDVDNFTSVSTISDPDSGGLRAAGAIRELSLTRIRRINSGVALSITGANAYYAVNAINLALHGRTRLTIDDVYASVSGTIDNSGGYANATYNERLLAFSVMSDVTMTVRGISGRSDLTVVGSVGTNWEAIDWADTGGSVGNVTDDFGADTLTDYILDGNTALAVSGGTLTSTGSHTTEKRTRWVNYSLNYFWSATGPWTDRALTVKSTPGATLTGHKTGLTLRATDATNYLDCYVLSSDGTTWAVNIDKVVAGVRTNLATAAVASGGPAASTGYWMRGKIQGNVVTVDYLTSAPSSPTNGTINTTATCTLTGADAAQFGSRGPVGWGGFSWVPGGTGATLDDLTAYDLMVVSGTIEGVDPVAISSAYSNAYLMRYNQNSAWIRHRSMIEVGGCSLTGMANAGSVTATSGDDATLRSSRVLRRITYTASGAPASASVSATGSPMTVTNNLGYAYDLAVYGGTVSSVTVQRNGQASAAQVANSSGTTQRLDPGESVVITYSSAPTIRRVPVP